MFTHAITALALVALGANAQNTYIKTKPDFVDPVITSGKALGSHNPVVGFGTWRIPNNEAGVNAVARALALGYRHFDGATAYGNQVTVGKGLAKGFKENPHIKREDIWVTTKIWATRHKDVAGSMRTNLQQLGLDYVDLALVHFPVGQAPGPDGKMVSSYDFVDMWKLMEKSMEPNAKGVREVRHIGISNFNVTQIDQLLASTKTRPYNHQIEMHPYLQDWKFYDYHQRVGIPLVAYAPFGNQNPAYHFRNWKSDGKLMLDDPVIEGIAARRGCTPGQVALVWNLDRNVTVIPKAFHAENAIDNYEARMKCKLTPADMAAIRGLDKNGTAGKRYWDMFCAMGLPGYYGLQDVPDSGPVPADYCEDPTVKAQGFARYDSSRTDLWKTPKVQCQR